MHSVWVKEGGTNSKAKGEDHKGAVDERDQKIVTWAITDAGERSYH